MPDRRSRATLRTRTRRQRIAMPQRQGADCVGKPMSRANDARYRWAVAPGRAQRLPILAVFWNPMIAGLIVGKTLKKSNALDDGGEGKPGATTRAMACSCAVNDMRGWAPENRIRRRSGACRPPNQGRTDFPASRGELLACRRATTQARNLRSTLLGPFATTPGLLKFPEWAANVKRRTKLPLPASPALWGR